VEKAACRNPKRNVICLSDIDYEGFILRSVPLFSFPGPCTSFFCYGNSPAISLLVIVLASIVSTIPTHAYGCRVHRGSKVEREGENLTLCWVPGWTRWLLESCSCDNLILNLFSHFAHTTWNMKTDLGPASSPYIPVHHEDNNVPASEDDLGLMGMRGLRLCCSSD
jgi:hypothetical protein